MEAADEPGAGGAGGGFNVEEMFGGGGDATPVTPLVVAEDPLSPGGSAPVVKAAEVVTPAAKAAVPAVEPAKAAGFDYEAWVKSALPEAPEGIAKVDNWKAQRVVTEKALRDLGVTAVERDELRSRLAEMEKAGVKALPESEAVKALTVELETLRKTNDGELSEYRAHKATQALESNGAFRAEFDGKRASLLASAKAVGAEAEIDEAAIESIFNATTELKLAKALGAIEDADARGLIAVKARAFMDLSTAREAAVKNPVEALKSWEDYDTAVMGETAKGFTKAFGDKLYGVLPSVAEKLKGDAFMGTAAGKGHLAKLGAMFQSGHIPNEATIVEALALRESAEVYREVAAQKSRRVVELEAALKEYQKLDPAQSGGAAVNKGVGGFDVERHFS